MVENLTKVQIQQFHADGFLIIEQGIVSPAALELLRERFDRIFEGEYQTGIKPDEVNWVKGRDPEDRTRQICNGWRADNTIAAQVLSARTGRLACELMGYRGVRIIQDNCLWKPPGTKSIGFHQDGSYAGYFVPSEMVTCWIALDDTAADAGPIEYVRGSHNWGLQPPSRTQFHAPDDWLAGVRQAAPPGVQLELVPVVVKAGGGSAHHGLTWHGSSPNRSTMIGRRALVSHFIPVEAHFHPQKTDLIYSRYRRRQDLTMDESFFPIVWSEDGGRSAWLAELPDLDRLSS